MPDEGAQPRRTLAEQLADLRRIAELSEPVLRNLLITQRYHDLSLDLARVVGSANANWSTFATWASKTAGQSIREENVPPEFTDFLRTGAKLDERLAKFYKKLGILGRFAPHLVPFEVARAIIQEVALQIAEGNLRVFSELAPLFAEFSDTFSDPERRSESALQQFLNRLRPGAPEHGGQDLLRQAFQSYLAATRTDDPAAQAELMLLGNVRIGLHEQTRLQQNIAGALDAPFSERIYERFGAAGPKFLEPLLRWAIRKGVQWFASGLLDDWQRLATRFLMKLTAPNGEEIPLGEDLPPEPFDPLLANLSNPELIALLERFDPNLQTTQGCAAVDWTILSDRMRFIGELFRVSQRDPSWFDQPFDAAQRSEIEAGRVPSGKL